MDLHLLSVICPSKQTLTDEQAAGNVGQAILNALLASPANFNITLLVRAESTSTIPQASNSAIKILKGDFNNQTFLQSSVTGQDALVFALNSTPTSFELQNTLSNVAAKAGVKRIIPSDFGSVSIHEQLPLRTKADRLTLRTLQTLLLSQLSPLTKQKLTPQSTWRKLLPRIQRQVGQL
jgi:hypothetical protein